MIYTQYGSPVEVVDYDEKTKMVAVRRYGDDKELIVSPSQLKADGGFPEIETACSQFTKPDAA